MAPRKRKSEEDDERAAGAATATDDGAEDASDHGDTGDGSDEADGDADAGGRQDAASADDKDAFDAADEADSIADLSEKEQDERLLDLQRRGYDVSVVRARLNHKKRKQHAQTAELERLQPVKFPDGTQAAGTLDRFEAPFSELGIKDVARKVYQGGTYAILYYDGNHVIKHREVFTVPGKPRSTDEVEEVRKTTPPPAPPPEQTGYHVRPPERDEEKEALREQIRNHDLRAMLAEQDRRHQEQMRVLMDAVKGATEKRSSNPVELIAALAGLAPFVPVFTEMVRGRGKNQQDVGELMKAFRDQNNDTLKQMKDAIDTATKGQRNDPMAAATTKLVDLAIAKTLGTSQQDPQALVFDMMKRMIPNLIENATEMAMMTARRESDAEPDDGKLTPKYFFEKAAAMVQPALEHLRQGRGGPMGPASAMSGMPMPGMPGMPMPGMPYPNPYGPPPVHPTAGVYPYTSAPPLPAPPGAPGMPGVAQPAAAVPPAMPAPGPASAVAPGPTAPAMPVPGPASAVAPPQPAAAPTDADTDIHPQVFVLMHQFLQSGKTGVDLAEWIDNDLADLAEKKKPGVRLLSDKAIDILETMDPKVLVGEFFKAAPPQLLAPFLVAPAPTPPGTPPNLPTIAPHVQDFVVEFCTWWRDNQED